ncbi:hypothetical protein O181_063643 [Austropuccinia psidii MF-1]|uniref:Uncharacterized protein n=1 Tax=Austropuccinia psidii MF-1 TaxID=1389203 RepID=A0A9Q3I0T1_9BASI|nr:hypothetical protein [Austropuccinia psidii MF-1]
MGRAAKTHGKKTKSSKFSPETTGDATIERILRPQQPQRHLQHPHQENCQDMQDLKKRTEKTERVTIPTRKIVKIKAKDYNLNFDGSDLEDFVKSSERIASIKGANERDLAMKIAFWSEAKDIRYEIEGMPGYEMEDWD